MCLGIQKEVTENKSSQISEICHLLEHVLLLFFSKTIKGGASDFNKFSQLPRWQKINKCLMSREKAKRVLPVLTLLLLSWDLPKEVKTLLPEQV